jgi:hypothetical protein
MSFSRERANEMASLAQLTYVAYKQGTEVVRNALESEHPPFIQAYPIVDFLYIPRRFTKEDKLVCCGYVASAKNQIVIAIRGTETLDDYFTNLLFSPNSENVHSGINTYIESFWEQIETILQRENNINKEIIVTGHSLGGAAAILITKKLNQLAVVRLETYIFGAPPVSTKPLQLNTPVYEIRNAGDTIPYLPKILAALVQRFPSFKRAISDWKPEVSKTLSEYSYVGTEYLLSQRYQLYLLEEPELESSWCWSLFVTNWLFSLREIEPSVKQKNETGEKINPIANFVNKLIQNSLQEHRAIKYVEFLNYGELPPWSSSED